MGGPGETSMSTAITLHHKSKLCCHIVTVLAVAHWPDVGPIFTVSTVWDKGKGETLAWGGCYKADRVDDLYDVWRGGDTVYQETVPCFEHCETHHNNIVMQIQDGTLID
jgi:hypothetical protein